MSLKAVYLYLIRDIPSLVTTTASGVQALNSDIWTDPSQVPPYAYQSLGQILVSVSCSSSQLAQHIVYQEGMSLEESTGDIALLGSPYESVELPREGFFSNQRGAETMRMRIRFSLPEETQSWDRIVNAELRIRYLLDQVWRQNRKSTSAYIPNLGDYTVSSNIFCTWQDYPNPPNAKEIFASYTLAYVRAVPK
jgi:hypothetical protein